MNNFISILILSTIFNPNIEDILGKNINSIPYNFTAFSIDDEISFNSKIYVAKNIDIDFFSKTIDVLAVKTDNNNTIISIETDFEEIIDESFYNTLVENYGQPDYIHRIKNTTNKKSYTLDDGTEVISSEGVLEDCKFKDNPLFIRWNKPNFYMVFTLQYNVNKTQLTIRKTEKK